VKKTPLVAIIAFLTLAPLLAGHGEPPGEKDSDDAKQSTLPALRPISDVDIANLMSQAEAKAQSGRLDEALADYNRVLSMDVSLPIASLACQNRGNIYGIKGDYDRALRDYEQAIRLNPANAGAYVNRALTLVERGDYEAALKDYDEAIRFDPTKYKAFYGRSFTHAQLGDFDAAQRDINETLRLNPKFAMAYVYRGGLAARQEKWKKARADYETARRIDPNLAPAWAAMAQLAWHRRQYREAVLDFEKLLSLKLPTADRAAALNSLAWIRATSSVRALRDGRRSVEEAREACELSNWEDSAVVDTLAAGLAESGDFEKAVHFQWFALSILPEGEDREAVERHLRLYESHQPYRESPRTQPSSKLPQATPAASPDPRPRQRSPRLRDARRDMLPRQEPASKQSIQFTVSKSLFFAPAAS
jgi:tetratricopeptide (TPR) repeat protein